ncbi:MAG: glycosyltransferase [Elusimicrobiaceae bacterium]|jgi:undecaprenyl-phosphate 4-deoxy-4-formamido-L-arabinose transferase
MTTENKLAVSVVIPVYNEEANLPELYARLVKTMDAMGESYEVLFSDDGSSDSSLEILKGFAARDPRVKVIEFSRNFGQHAAVMAAMEESVGATVVTLDADLQNPPEEIPKLMVKIREGYEAVGGWRQDRDDNILRKIPSRILNSLSAYLFGVKLKDYGCMLRAYKREVVDQLVKCPEVNTYIPALANSFAKRVTEVPVAHAARTKGESKYNIVKLLRLNFDLMTGFSLLPIQLVGFAGIAVAVTGLAFAVFLFARRLIIGPEAEGVFTLLAVLFFFVGIQILALGIVGEYVGRIYMEVRRRPRFVIRQVHTKGS